MTEQSAPSGAKAKRPAAPTDRGEARLSVANQWQLVWWKFRKHRLAMVAGGFTLFLYAVAAFAEFFAPYPPQAYSAAHTYVPPQRIHLFQATATGRRFYPHVNGFKVQVDPESYKRTYTVDETAAYPIGLFVRGAEYRLFGLFKLDLHLIGAQRPGDPVYLIGTDRLGRDVLSRTIYGARVSMSVGLVGVGLSLLFGVILGGISGYYGGLIDNIIQRAIEILRSLPTIPLWMGLSAAIPLTWPPLRTKRKAAAANWHSVCDSCQPRTTHKEPSSKSCNTSCSIAFIKADAPSPFGRSRRSWVTFVTV